jgi:hypothetical protein
MDMQTGVRIKNVQDLRLQEALLQEILVLQEAELRASVRDISKSLSLSNVIKNTVSDLGKDKEFKSDALGATMNFGAQFMLDKFMNRREKGIKGYIIHAGLKKLLSFLIARNKTAILEKITR